MVNLLPRSALERVRLEYRLRLATVAVRAASLALIFGAALLLPTYFMTWSLRTGVLSQASLADQSLAQQDLAAAAENVRSSAALLSAVRRQLAVPRPSSAAAALLSARTSGISIVSINYLFDGSVSSVQLTGTALTRTDLLGFKDSLTRTPGVKSVDLPLQYLAEASNISFSLSVTYVPPPASAAPPAS